ncbi:MAG: transposase, partial [Mesorhizobium sp.]
MADIEAANRFVAQTYLPAHNARFARPAAVEDSAFVAADPQQLAQILCIEEERVVARD